VFGGREPFHLHAVILELAPEKRLVGERRIDEVPDVGVLLIHVADAREEAAEFRGGAVDRCDQGAIGFLDRDGVFRCQRKREHARELLVDVGAEGDLRFGEAEPARPGADLAARGEARDGERRRILREIRVAPLEDLPRWRG
jgi:hypothetical protein